MTNKNARFTPFRNLSKRRPDFNATEGKNVIIRKLNKGKLTSFSEQASQNKLWYQTSPGRHIIAWTEKGNLNGPAGYIQPAICALNNALQGSSSKWNSLFHKCEVTAMIRIRDNTTVQAKIMYFASQTKLMKVSCTVAIREDISDNKDLIGIGPLFVV